MLLMLPGAVFTAHYFLLLQQLYFDIRNILKNVLLNINRRFGNQYTQGFVIVFNLNNTTTFDVLMLLYFTLNKSLTLT